MAQRKLLLADDSVTIQKVVNLTFADEGIEVITVGDGDAALEKIKESAPDLVMADVNMPGLNGYQLCEKIRQSDALKKTPVILLVGSFEPFDETEARRVGANDFLTKPFQSIRQLVTKVTDLLNSSAQNGDEESMQQTISSAFENANTLRNFTPSEEYLSAAATESLPSSSSQSSAQFGDAGMDDEMIQTETTGSFALDETAKFESREVAEPEFEAAKTQPLSAEDLKDFSFSHPPIEAEESANETSAEQHLKERGDSQAEDQAPEISGAPQQTAPKIDFSEQDDLLEIPFDDEEWEEEEPEEAATATASVSAEETSSQTAETQTQVTEPEAQTADLETAPVSSEAPKTAVYADEQQSVAQPQTEQSQTSSEAQPTASISPEQLSPELIDAIAQRVVEKLSEKAVKDVAWEVVPQMADLIIKKMAEEKLKE